MLALFMQPLIKKYQPKSMKEVVGQNSALRDLMSIITNFKKQKKKAALIYGPSGVGKTCSIYALANDFNYEIYEINASDVRNKEQINQKLGSVVKQQSLFSKGKIILVDEIDGLSGSKDKGGIKAIAKLIDETTFPIILTAANPWDDKFSILRSRSNLVKFEPLSVEIIFSVLKTISKKEKIDIKDDILKILARKAGGDIRAAINDLGMLTSKEATKEVIDELAERDKRDTIINALVKIFKTTDLKIAINALENVDEDFNEVMLWIDENLPKEYEKPEDLARAYDKLSKADVFNRRIKRWQHWRFLVYINALLTAGIAVSKDSKYKKRIEYKRSGRILKMWWTKQKSMKKRAIAKKIAKKTHTSTKEVLKTMPYIRIIFKKNKTMANDIINDFGLDREEVEWLRK